MLDAQIFFEGKERRRISSKTYLCGWELKKLKMKIV